MNDGNSHKIVEALVNCCPNNLPDLERTDDLWDDFGSAAVASSFNNNYVKLDDAQRTLKEKNTELSLQGKRCIQQ